jgi:hypothetical protein
MADKPTPTKISKRIRKSIVNKTGYEPEDLLAAPDHPPELKNVRPNPRPEQLWVVTLGFIFAVFGLIVFMAYPGFTGILVATVGSLAIVLATLVRI